MSTDNAPAFRHAVGIVSPRVTQRLKPQNAPVLILGNHAFDTVRVFDVILQHGRNVCRRFSKAGREYLVLNRRHSGSIINACMAYFHRWITFSVVPGLGGCRFRTGK